MKNHRWCSCTRFSICLSISFCFLLLGTRPEKRTRRLVHPASTGTDNDTEIKNKKYLSKGLDFDSGDIPVPVFSTGPGSKTGSFRVRSRSPFYRNAYRLSQLLFYTHIFEPIFVIQWRFSRVFFNVMGEITKRIVVNRNYIYISAFCFVKHFFFLS